ncbi:large ribosomal subunit protein P1-like [Aotus nancymaae]|uniref:large ribosomal subunit protein P1-like n=1 Tax=Aotus nancymaae TaxID=37293 RepID=UPI0030FE482F
MVDWFQECTTWISKFMDAEVPKLALPKDTKGWSSVFTGYASQEYCIFNLQLIESMDIGKGSHHVQQHQPHIRPCHGLSLGARLHCIYLVLILYHDKKDKINALIKAAGVNFESFWPGLCAKALANINTGSLICTVGAGGPAPAAGAAPAGGPAVSTAAAAPTEENKVEAKKEESKECDNMGFGVFD